MMCYSAALRHILLAHTYKFGFDNDGVCVDQHPDKNIPSS